MPGSPAIPSCSKRPCLAGPDLKGAWNVDWPLVRSSQARPGRDSTRKQTLTSLIADDRGPRGEGLHDPGRIGALGCRGKGEVTPAR